MITDPRTWALGDAEPTDVRAVTDAYGDHWWYRFPLWESFTGSYFAQPRTWWWVLSERGPVTEYVRGAVSASLGLPEENR